MRNRIKNLLECNSLLLAVASSFLILVLSLIDMEEIPNLKYSYIDKLEHLVAHGFMSFFWLKSHQLKKIKGPVFIFILRGFVHAPFSELI